jgi:hypothetical protein
VRKRACSVALGKVSTPIYSSNMGFPVRMVVESFTRHRTHYVCERATRRNRTRAEGRHEIDILLQDEGWLGFALFLNSAYGFAAMLLLVLLILIRIPFEERTLVRASGQTIQ